MLLFSLLFIQIARSLFTNSCRLMLRFVCNIAPGFTFPSDESDGRIVPLSVDIKAFAKQINMLSTIRMTRFHFHYLRALLFKIQQKNIYLLISIQAYFGLSWM